MKKILMGLRFPLSEAPSLIYASKSSFYNRYVKTSSNLTNYFYLSRV